MPSSDNINLLLPSLPFRCEIMLDFDRKAADMAIPNIPAATSKLPNDSTPSRPSPNPSSPRVPDASSSSPSPIAAYEHYLRLPELSKLWSSRSFPEWRDEPILKPALQALEITFRLISTALSDPRPYADHREWERRLESLSSRQIELIAALSEAEKPGGAPVADLTSSPGVLTRDRSSQEVWKLPGTSPVVSRTSDQSLLPRLAAWERSEAAASAIMFEVEARMRRCPFTLGIGEPNLSGKPNLEYDLIVRPSELHALKRSPAEARISPANHENRALLTVHQILESWIFCAKQLLSRIGERIDGSEFAAAASDCWMLERIWKLLSDIVDLHLLMDPDDFLRLKNQIAIRATNGSEAFCFRSAGLMEVAGSSRELRRRVPGILGVEVDPNGGPRVQQAAMGLFHRRRRGEGEESGKIHLLQAFQGVEAAVKRFYFGYRQVVTAVMGSLEAAGGRGLSTEPSDALSQMYLDPPYFPSLDAAKTFLGEMWQHQRNSGSSYNI